MSLREGRKGCFEPLNLPQRRIFSGQGLKIQLFHVKQSLIGGADGAPMMADGANGGGMGVNGGGMGVNGDNWGLMMTK